MKDEFRKWTGVKTGKITKSLIKRKCIILRNNFFAKSLRILILEVLTRYVFSKMSQAIQVRFMNAK